MHLLKEKKIEREKKQKSLCKSELRSLEVYLLLHFESSPGSTKWTSFSLSSTDSESEHLPLLWPTLARSEERSPGCFLLLFIFLPEKQVSFQSNYEDFLKTGTLEYVRTQESSSHFSDTFIRPAPCLCSPFVFLLV